MKKHEKEILKIRFLESFISAFLCSVVFALLFFLDTFRDDAVFKMYSYIISAAAFLMLNWRFVKMYYSEIGIGRGYYRDNVLVFGIYGLLAILFAAADVPYVRDFLFMPTRVFEAAGLHPVASALLYVILMLLCLVSVPLVYGRRENEDNANTFFKRVMETFLTTFFCSAIFAMLFRLGVLPRTPLCELYVYSVSTVVFVLLTWRFLRSYKREMRKEVYLRDNILIFALYAFLSLIAAAAKITVVSEFLFMPTMLLEAFNIAPLVSVCAINVFLLILIFAASYRKKVKNEDLHKDHILLMRFAETFLTSIVISIILALVLHIGVSADNMNIVQIYARSLSFVAFFMITWHYLRICYKEIRPVKYYRYNMLAFASYALLSLIFTEFLPRAVTDFIFMPTTFFSILGMRPLYSAILFNILLFSMMFMATRVSRIKSELPEHPLFARFFETFITSIIASVPFTLLLKYNVIQTSLVVNLYAFGLSAAIFLICSWLFLQSYYHNLNKKSYWRDNIIVFAVYAVVTIALSLLNQMKILSYMFFPVGFFELIGAPTVVSAAIMNAVLFMFVFIIPLELKRPKSMNPLLLRFIETFVATFVCSAPFAILFRLRLISSIKFVYLVIYLISTIAFLVSQWNFMKSYYIYCGKEFYYRDNIIVCASYAGIAVILRILDIERVIRYGFMPLRLFELFDTSGFNTLYSMLTVSVILFAIMFLIPIIYAKQRRRKLKERSYESKR
ncbi:MAG: hypothetical protein Q4C12_04535 [Clostridia bacterium]|nr:hypothetical protein [Clostridia bacterium]